MNSIVNNPNGTVIQSSTNIVFDFTSLKEHQKNFMLWIYAQVYNPETGLWLGQTEPCIEFSRSWVNSQCRSYGYAGTIHWIVRKRFGRRTQRGTYQIPELLQIHSMIQSGDIKQNTVTSVKGQVVALPTRKAN